MKSTNLDPARMFRSLLFTAASLCIATPAAFAEGMGSEAVLETVEKRESKIVSVANQLWTLAEISLLEIKSAALLKKELTDAGFTITEDHIDGVPTAFVAEYGKGEPVVGIMLEYDALPGLGNAPVPRKQPRDDGITSGHGCGHNIIGAGALGAALSIKDLLESTKTTGTLRVYGGASEETEGAKVYMAREGLFTDVDAMLHMHPGNATGTFNVRTSAQQQVFIEFQGKTAHAGNTPWEGRSALDAVELFLHGVNNMREHVKPSARIHYVIREGGKAANIVPERASVQLTFRGESRGDVNAGVEWLEQIANGAALMTQTSTLFVPYYGMYDLLPNRPLAERMQKHLETIGVTRFSEDEQNFAKSLQTEVELETTGMLEVLPPIPDEPFTGGSTDVGDISWLVPTMGMVVATVPQGIGLHTWMASASHGTSIGEKGAVLSAKALAALGWDIFTDAELRKAMQEDFASRTEGFEYQSPIPDRVKEPISLPDEYRSYGSIIELREALLKQSGDHEHAHGDHFHEH